MSPRKSLDYQHYGGIFLWAVSTKAWSSEGSFKFMLKLKNILLSRRIISTFLSWKGNILERLYVISNGSLNLVIRVLSSWYRGVISHIKYIFVSWNVIEGNITAIIKWLLS